MNGFESNAHCGWGGDSRRRSSSAAADAPELDAQDGHLGGQKRNARAHRPERAVQQQVEHHAHRGRREARHDVGQLAITSDLSQEPLFIAEQFLPFAITPRTDRRSLLPELPQHAP